MKNLNNKYKKRFLSVFFSIFGIFSILLLFIFFGYKFLKADPVYDPLKQRDSTLITEKEFKQQNEQKSNGIFTPPIRTNILLTCVDESETRTDFMVIISFISTTNQINIISIPRDTYVNFKGEDLKELRSINKGAPSHMKATEIHAWTKDEGINMLQKYLEKELGIKIDYYAKMNFKGFRNIIDTVGGIEFNVPRRMYYSDPTQDLYINLKPGLQTLDGNKSEQLLRFRKNNDTTGYARGDLERIEVQQDFIKEFFKQVLNKDTIMNNLGEIALNIVKYVDTNFNITDLPKYLESIAKININNIQIVTLPGYAQYIDDISYYILDKNETDKIIDKFFYGNTDPDKEPIIQTTFEQNENSSKNE